VKASSVQLSILPGNALLDAYRRSGAFTDCYWVAAPYKVSLARYAEAFYTTWLFKLERWIIGWAVNLPSSDVEAKQLATGSLTRFAAWTVEARTETQLLLCDINARTRSWLMVEHVDAGSHCGTVLYFGSAVVPIAAAKTGERLPGWRFKALLGFHRIYSRALLAAARKRLLATQDAQPLHP